MLFKHPLTWVWLVLAMMLGIAGLLGNRATQTPSGGLHGASEAEKAESQQGRTSRTNRDPGALNGKRQSREYEPDCSERENADLCAQRRMAEAAESQTRLNEVGLVLLGCTLVATGAAALYARHAALAAKKTVKTMEDTAERQLRAYLGPDGAFLKGFLSDYPEIWINLRNFGQTPARKVRALTRHHFPLADSAETDTWAGIDDTEHKLRTVDPGAVLPMAIVKLGEFNDGLRLDLADAQRVLHCRVTVDYEDIYYAKYTRVFCFYLYGKRLRGVSMADDDVCLDISPRENSEYRRHD